MLHRTRSRLDDNTTATAQHVLTANWCSVHFVKTASVLSMESPPIQCSLKHLFSDAIILTKWDYTLGENINQVRPRTFIIVKRPTPEYHPLLIICVSVVCFFCSPWRQDQDVERGQRVSIARNVIHVFLTDIILFLQWIFLRSDVLVNSPSVAGKNLVYPITKQEMNVHKQTTGEVGDRKSFATNDSSDRQIVVMASICTGCIPMHCLRIFLLM